MIKAVRGTRDLLPPETALWNFVEKTVREVFHSYNYQEIRTPIFEATELFARGVGEDTDIVSKEMYSWEDGASAEATIRDAWLSQHSNAIAKHPRFNERLVKEPFKQRSYEYGFNVLWDGQWTIVRPRYPIFPLDVRQLEHYGKEWLEQNLDDLPELKNDAPRLRLVTLEDGVFPNTKELATSKGIEIEVIKIENFDPAQSLTLRPENTAGVVRAYIEHNLASRGLNKLYYIGPQFRRERPQKGRYRQFYQIGAEIIGPATAGSESPARDAELLEMLATLLNRLGIAGWTLELNSIGSPSDRTAFNEALKKALEPVVANMCGDCQRRAVTNPLRVLDCKVPADQPIIEKLPRITQFLSDISRAHFDDVCEILTKVGVPFTLNDRLVRGLDYYTRTAFEFTHGELGAQNAILGGGRYDGLSEALGGPAAPGIGFAIGEDRLVMSLQAEAAAKAAALAPIVYIAPLGPGMNAEAAKLARELRQHKNLTAAGSIELGDDAFKLKKSFETADKIGARYILIVGENEAKSGSFPVKNLKSGNQISVARADLAEKILELP